MDDDKRFRLENRKNIAAQRGDFALRGLSNIWLRETGRYKYSYFFSWLGRPIIQFPQDILAMQEIIWEVKPKLIIETGIARGGGLIFYASILELIGDGIAVGIDIDIREHNRIAIENHPVAKRIRMISGSSINPSIFETVKRLARDVDSVMVILDSNHTHDHVLNELELYSALVTKGSYLIVCDTAIEDMPQDFFVDRPWSKGNNPKTAVLEFLNDNDRFEVCNEIDDKLLISASPNGYLRCIKD